MIDGTVGLDNEDDDDDDNDNDRENDLMTNRINCCSSSLYNKKTDKDISTFTAHTAHIIIINNHNHHHHQQQPQSSISCRQSMCTINYISQSIFVVSVYHQSKFDTNTSIIRIIIHH
jgi:hypothetical protein